MDGQALTGLVDNVLLLFTVLFAAYQLREMNRQSSATAAATRGQVYQSLTDAMLSIDRLFVERPELRRYFYGGAAVPEEGAEEQRVMALAELLCDFFDDCTAQAHLLDEGSSAVWRAYAHGIARTSPAVRRLWRENGEWYSTRLHVLLDDVMLEDAVAALDTAASPARPPEPAEASNR